MHADAACDCMRKLRPTGSRPQPYRRSGSRQKTSRWQHHRARPRSCPSPIGLPPTRAVLRRHNGNVHRHNEVARWHNEVAHRHNDVARWHNEVAHRHNGNVHRHNEVAHWHNENVHPHNEKARRHNENIRRHDAIARVRYAAVNFPDAADNVRPVRQRRNRPFIEPAAINRVCCPARTSRRPGGSMKGTYDYLHLRP